MDKVSELYLRTGRHNFQLFVFMYAINYVYMRTRLDSRRLRYFAHVVECGSFVRAASALNVTQPALSTAVKKLEDELGVALLDRSVSPIAPTLFGEAVYRSAKSLDLEAERLHRELRDCADLNNGSVAVVVSATFPSHLIVEAYNIIRETYPGFRLSVEVSGYSFALESMLRGDCDFIFSQLPSSRTDLRVLHREMLHDRFAVISSATHPLTLVDRPTFADLVRYPWIGGGPFEAFLPGWAQRFGDHGAKPPRPLINTLTIPLTEMALHSQSYLTMLPVKCIEHQLSTGSLVELPFPELHWDQAKGASWAANRSLAPSATLFLDTFDALLTMVQF